MQLIYFMLSTLSEADYGGSVSHVPPHSLEFIMKYHQYFT